MGVGASSLCYNSAMKGRISAVLDPTGIDIVSHNANHTIRVGQLIGSCLEPGDLVLLFGTFGVGKTHLTKGIAQALGVEQADVTSPTFVIVNTYEAGPSHGAMRIHHVDLYRLEGGASDFDSIGLEELWDTEALCIIEWAERLESGLPSEYLKIEIDHLAESKRLLRITPRGARYEAVIEQIRAKVAGKS